MGETGGRHAINLSTAWLPPDLATGRLAWLRRFGRPAGIGPGDRVWLVIEAAVGGEVALGGEPLPRIAAGACWRREVTTALRARNELALAVTAGGGAPSVTAAHGRRDLPATIGRVRLEIEPAA
jgi:hypothetical protein